MKEFQNKRKLRRKLYSLPSLIVLSVMTFFLVKGAIGMLMKEGKTASRVDELEEMVANLSGREDKVRAELESLKTTEGLNEEIRSRFNVTREGENVAVIVDNTKKATSTEHMEERWYKRIWNAIIRP